MLNLNALVLFAALSIHSIFEGIALGVTNNFSATLNIMIGLLFHKGPAAVSLGISFSKNFKDEKKLKCAKIMIVLFAIMTPIGIVVGILLKSTNAIVEVIFSCIAGGTFIYIAASEVIVI